MPDQKPTDMDDPSIHRLEGSAPTQGGLVKKKDNKSSSKDASSSPVVQRQSLYGLDKLAELKREEKKLELEKHERRYRDKHDDTPGHGVSDSIRNDIVR